MYASIFKVGIKLMSPLKPFSINARHAYSASSSKFLSYEEAQTYMITQGLKTTDDWRYWRVYSRPSFIPSNPHKLYKNRGWKGIPEFLGYQKRGPRELDLKLKQKRETYHTLWALQSEGRQKLINAVKSQDFWFEFNTMGMKSHCVLLFRFVDNYNQDWVDDEWAPLLIRCTLKPRSSDDRYCFWWKQGFVDSALVGVSVSEDRFFIFPADYVNKRHQQSSNGIFLKTDKAKAFEVSEENLAQQLRNIWKISQRKTVREWLSDKQLKPRNPYNFSITNTLIDDLYKPSGLKVRYPSDGEHCNVVVGNHKILHRVALRSAYQGSNCQISICTTSIGRSIGQSIRRPFPFNVDIDFVVVIVPSASDKNVINGVFILPKYELQPCFEHDSHKGKTNLYLYPPDIQPQRKTGKDAQRMQLKYYISFDKADINTKDIKKFLEIVKSSY